MWPIAAVAPKTAMTGTPGRQRSPIPKLTRSLAKDHPLLYEAIHASLRSHHSSFADAVEQFSGDRGFVEAFKNLRRAAS